MLDRSEVIINLLENYEDPVGAEIGVYRGRNADNILSHTDAFLYLIDPWDLEQYEGDDTGDCVAEGTQEELKKAKEECLERLKKHSIETDYSIIQRDHREVELEEKLDFVFLDGVHTYKGTIQQILQWYPQVKDGGLVIGHDWDYPDYDFKVKEAVTDLAELLGQEIHLGDGYTWWFKK